jgi:hypothetical protein
LVIFPSSSGLVSGSLHARGDHSLQLCVLILLLTDRFLLAVTSICFLGF